jgi:glycosyltransferase involved in cell wall biosynthesis
MPAITALLHARNDALRLGRALETLLPCDEILVVDLGTHYATRRIAREYGARVVSAKANITPSQSIHLARHDWILCLEPRESLTEALVASLFEWKAEWKPETQSPEPIAFSFLLREETPNGWQINPTPQTRLVPRAWSRWQGLLPASEPSAIPLEGALLRFIQP